MAGRIRLLGLTGSIASGKSTVAEMFRQLGAAVVDADALAREVVEPGSPALGEVVALFGEDILNQQGQLDREQVGKRVFADAEARKRLEEILHPAIRELSIQRLAELRASGVPLIVYEAPLLFEAGAEKRVDAVAVVTVPEQEQLRRLVERNGFTRQEARARVDSQMSQEEKVSRADYVIDNGGSRESLQSQTEYLYRELTGALSGKS